MTVSRIALACAFAYLLTGCASAQSTGQSPAFEAASLKPAAPPAPYSLGRNIIPGPSGGPGTKDPGRVRYSDATLRTMLLAAYGVRTFQLVGPSWIDNDRFDFAATMPPDTTMERFRQMLRKLLSERFQIALHREDREMTKYTLVVAKGGPKLKESVPASKVDHLPPGPSPASDGPVRLGPDGFVISPPLPTGRQPAILTMNGRTKLNGYESSMPDLAARLSFSMNRMVTDATGLTGKYDYSLSFSTEGLDGPSGPVIMGGDGTVQPPQARDPDGFPSIFSAVQTQLGLKLEPIKGPVEVIVIDHAQRTPIEN
jgi:uncharacterized protein (TIGR03435 family)